MSRQRSKTKKVSLQTNSASSLLVSNLKTAAPWVIITSRRNQHFTWFSASEVACKFSSRLLLVRRSPSMWSHLTPLRMSRQKFRIRRASLQTSSASSLRASNLKMAAHWVIITSRRSQHSTWFFASEVDYEKFKGSKKSSIVTLSFNLNKVIAKKSFL